MRRFRALASVETDKQYGCLFCRSGAEQKLAARIREKEPGVETLSPVRVRIRRRGDTAAEETVALFPGYLFFRAEASFPAQRLAGHEDVYRLLENGSDGWPLQGRDRELAETFFNTGGVIGLSRVYYEGDRIRVSEGFLKDYEGQITRVNRRSGTAQIKLDFDGRELTLWLGFELLDPPDN